MQKFVQHERLGKGCNAVYRATRIADSAEVALKRIEGWAALPPEAQHTALREVAALKAIDHPHALRLLDSFTDKGDLCLVAPLLRPGARAFDSSALPLSPEAVARVGYQLASVLAYLHALSPPLLHRDVKPANLLLETWSDAAVRSLGPLSPPLASALVLSGKVVLGDFGSALALSRALATGTVSGTPAYKAREILLEEEYGAPADVWAYGVTLLQLGTGHVAGGTSAARKAIMGLRGSEWTLAGALAGEFKDKFASAAEEEAWGRESEGWRVAWGALGEGLQGVIERCLAVEPGARPGAGELLGSAAFERERGAALLAVALDKLVEGAPVTAEELVAVLEAGVDVKMGVLELACKAVRGVAAGGAGEAWVQRACAALLGVIGGGGAWGGCMRQWRRWLGCRASRAQRRA